MNDAEEMARRLEALPGYRVLRALDVKAGVDRLRPRAAGERIAVVADCETTGLDVTVDRLVEIATQRFLFDESGRIIEIEHVSSWLEDPDRPMPERLTLLTGLSNSELAGKKFDEAAICKILGGADVVIAHNAAFDRPFLDRRFPILNQLAWACSLTQIDWLVHGFDGRSLGHLLSQAGYFFQGHRASNDVQALTTLLRVVDKEGCTILSHLLRSFEKDVIRINAIGAPFESKDQLKAAGYRWDVDRRFWWREVDEDALLSETAWLAENIYRGGGQPSIQTISARDRFKR